MATESQLLEWKINYLLGGFYSGKIDSSLIADNLPKIELLRDKYQSALRNEGGNSAVNTSLTLSSLDVLIKVL
ncbi:MAG TPA: hypothetical protein VJH92_03200 [Candidatus Nanoarchaeia archaeon]|nr:hypothetical protein [Candidatus Nanoarchaeia archaeon]